MYIPRWKRIIILKRILLLMIIAAISVSAFVIHLKLNKKDKIVFCMDHDAINFRTGGPLIIYNKSFATIGFYLDDLPIYHDILEMDLPNGIYHGEYEINTIDIYNCEEAYFGSIPIDDIELKLNFKNAVVVVYDNE